MSLFILDAASSSLLPDSVSIPYTPQTDFPLELQTSEKENSVSKISFPPTEHAPSRTMTNLKRGTHAKSKLKSQLLGVDRKLRKKVRVNKELMSHPPKAPKRVKTDSNSKPGRYVATK